MTQVKNLTKEVERGNKERATLREAMVISLNLKVAITNRESVRDNQRLVDHNSQERPIVQRLVADIVSAVKTLVRDREWLTKSITKNREDVQEAHSSNKDDEQCGSKAKKALPSIQTPGKQKKNPDPGVSQDLGP